MQEKITLWKKSNTMAGDVLHRAQVLFVPESSKVKEMLAVPILCFTDHTHLPLKAGSHQHYCCTSLCKC